MILREAEKKVGKNSGHTNVTKEGGGAEPPPPRLEASAWKPSRGNRRRRTRTGQAVGAMHIIIGQLDLPS